MWHILAGHFFTVQLFYQVGRSNNKTSFFGCCCSGKKTGADQYIVNSQSMGWTTARDYCRTYYTDLASLRNNAENQMIQNVSGQMTVWLGLFRDIWKWSDQTYSSMRYWKADQSVLSSMVGTCGALCNPDKINTRLCCLITLGRKWRFVSMAMSVQDSMDLNDPAVQDNILNKVSILFYSKS
uniref:C-type lectin domain-containing protein n=1 Tax=Mastacembelus armatus TaxID=205130 RepID=A0A3Q3LTE1_9TELE